MEEDGGVLVVIGLEGEGEERVVNELENDSKDGEGEEEVELQAFQDGDGGGQGKAGCGGEVGWAFELVGFDGVEGVPQAYENEGEGWDKMANESSHWLPSCSSELLGILLMLK